MRVIKRHDERSHMPGFDMIPDSDEDQQFLREIEHLSRDRWAIFPPSGAVISTAHGWNITSMRFGFSDLHKIRAYRHPLRRVGRWYGAQYRKAMNRHPLVRAWRWAKRAARAVRHMDDKDKN